ncbi:MAG: diguanylate cyclase protein [Clostridiaceae bacterium]|jgi:diguanylate cyclase (GGDEF)-like protein|nr:diguanylate cyclase protein [Clostridiaceae bacterium]
MENKYSLAEVKNLLKKISKKKFYDSSEALNLCEKVIDICQKNNFEKEKGICLSLMGNIHSFSSNYSEGIDCLLSSIEIFEKYDMLQEKANAYRWMGNIYFDLNDYENAFDYYLKTLEIEENIPGNISMAGALNNIGEIYKYIKEYKRASEYYFRSYNIDKENDFKITSGSVLVNLSDTYYYLKDYNKALDYANKALEVLIKYKNYYAVPEVYKDLAQVHSKLNNNELAREYYEKALEYTKKYEYYYLQIEVLLSYGDFLMNMGKYKDAIDFLLKAYDISVNQGNLAKITDVCLNLAQVYEKIDENKAFQFYKLFADYEKKIEENRHMAISRSISIRKKLNLINREKETLQSNNRKLEETIKNLAIIDELGHKIASTADTEIIFQYLLSALEKFFKVDSFGIGFYNEEADSISYNYFTDKGNPVNFPPVKLDDKNSFAAYCLRNNEIIVINDVEKDFNKYIQLEFKPAENKLLKGNKTNSLLYCPLVYNNKKIGILTIQSYEKDFFIDYYVRIIRAISSYASIALTNAMSLSELKKEIEVSEKLNKKLNFLADNDELTGIPNRRSFLKYIENTWEELKNSGKNLSLILVDIDYFKEFNDNYGHMEGDKCIKFIADILKSSLRKNYFVTRYGGDEFCIIIPNESEEEVEAFAEFVRSKVTNAQYPHCFSKVCNIVTISLGTATVIPSNSENIRNLLVMADAALYNAKKLGRNKCMRS